MYEKFYSAFLIPSSLSIIKQLTVIAQDELKGEGWGWPLAHWKNCKSKKSTVKCITNTTMVR
jgi:hypothetical protein